MNYLDAQLAEDFAYELWRGEFFSARRGGLNIAERKAYKDYAEAFAARTLALQTVGAQVWMEVSALLDSKLLARRRLDAALARRRAFGAAAVKLSD